MNGEPGRPGPLNRTGASVRSLPVRRLDEPKKYGCGSYTADAAVKALAAWVAHVPRRPMPLLTGPATLLL